MKKDEFGFNTFNANGEDNEFKCFKCLKGIKEGFICEDTKRVYCIKCQEGFNMYKCKHDKRGEHKHIKFKRVKE